MTEQVKEQTGICPAATGIVVFRDTEGRWRGRFQGESPHAHNVPLPSHNGQQARESLAKYLGVRLQRIHIFDPSGRRH